MASLNELYATLANGCTWWPDGNWGDICNQHDIDWRTRCVGFCASNWYLFRGVAASGHPLMAGLMWLGVTLAWPKWMLMRRVEIDCGEYYGE